MEVLQVAAFALIAAAVLLVLRGQRPELAMYLGLGAGAMIFLFALAPAGRVIEALSLLGSRAHVDRLYLGTVLKITGLAYVAEFAAQVLRDAGEGAIAAKVEMAGKLFILALSLPIVFGVLETVLRMLE